MKKAKTFIIPMLALAVFGMTACGGGEQSSSSQQQSSSSGKASIPVASVASVEITNKEALQKEWHVGDSSRSLSIKVLDTDGKQLSETVLIATGDLKISSSDENVVATMGAGVYAKAAGTATITVTIEGKTDTVAITVVAEDPAITSIAAIQADKKVNITATVGAISNKGFVLTDGSAAIYVYLDKATEGIAVGDVVNVKGTAKEYTGNSGSHGFIRLTDNVEYAKVEGTPASLAPTELTKEIADSLPNKKAFTDYKAYTWITKVGKSGNYITYPVDGSSVMIEPLNATASALGEEGKEYRVTCFFIGYDTSYSYAGMIMASVEEYHAGVDSVTVTGPASVRAEESIRLSAACLPESAVQDVVWSSENPAIATVNEKGKVTGVAEGTVKIYATAAGTNVKGYLEVTVGPKSTIPVESIMINGPIALNPGKSGQITATIDPEGASTNVVYTSSNPEIAVVDEDGVVTAKAVGRVRITANPKDDDSKESFIEIDVHEPCLGDIVTGLVKEGEELEFNARVLQAPTSAQTKAYNIAIWDGQAATVARMNKDITVPTVGDSIKIKGVVASYSGGYQLDCTASADLVGEASAAVEAPVAIPIPGDVVSSIYDIAFGENPQLIPPAPFYRLDECVITGGSGSYIYFDYHGTKMETTLQGLNMKVGHTYEVEGFFYGTYTSTTGEDKYLTFVPTKASEVEGTVYIDSTVKSVVEGQKIDIVAKTVGNDSDTYTWNSSNTDAATVDTAGKVTGVAPGKTTITATSVADPTRSASIEVTVIAGETHYSKITQATGFVDGQKYLIGAVKDDVFYAILPQTNATGSNPKGTATDTVVGLDASVAFTAKVDAEKHVKLSFTSNNETYWLVTNGDSTSVRIIKGDEPAEYWVWNETGLSYSKSTARYIDYYANGGDFRNYKPNLNSTFTAYLYSETAL